MVEVDKSLVINGEGKIHLNNENESSVLFAASIIWPIIDTYYIVALFLISINRDTELDKVEILKKIQWLGESLYEDRTIQFFESCNQDSIKNAVATFEGMKVIKLKQNNYKIKKLYREEENLKSFVQKINDYRQQTSFTNMSSPNGSMRRSMMANYPFMAKL
jgi:hypothetical protein